MVEPMNPFEPVKKTFIRFPSCCLLIHVEWRR
jgi:hypothetical protein